MACMFYFARCMNIIFNSLLAQLVKYDVHTTRKIKFTHAIIYHILLTMLLRYWTTIFFALRSHYHFAHGRANSYNFLSAIYGCVYWRYIVMAIFHVEMFPLPLYCDYCKLCVVVVSMFIVYTVYFYLRTIQEFTVLLRIKMHVVFVLFCDIIF